MHPDLCLLWCCCTYSPRPALAYTPSAAAMDEAELHRKHCNLCNNSKKSATQALVQLPTTSDGRQHRPVMRCTSSEAPASFQGMWQCNYIHLSRQRSRASPSRQMMQLEIGSNMQRCKQTAVVTWGMPRCLVHHADVSVPIGWRLDVPQPMTRLKQIIVLATVTPAMMTERDVLCMKRKTLLGGRLAIRWACTSSMACLTRATNSSKKAKPAYAKIANQIVNG